MPPTDEQCVQSCLDGHRRLSPSGRAVRDSLAEAPAFPPGQYGASTEAAQETFVRAYFALGDLRKPEAFFSWLFGIADRVAKETQRAAMRQRTVDLGADRAGGAGRRAETSRWQSRRTEAVASCPTPIGKSSCCGFTAVDRAWRSAAIWTCRWER